MYLFLIGWVSMVELHVGFREVVTMQSVQIAHPHSPMPCSVTLGKIA